MTLGLAGKTLVIWTSDNGAPINRDLADRSRGSNRPLHGRGYTTSEGAFRVPTLMWQPGKVRAGTVCDDLVTTMDLLPTFAVLAGGQSPQDRKIDGHDISPLIYSEPDATSPYESFFYYRQDELQAVRSGPWKLFLPIAPSAGHPHLAMSEKPRALLFHLIDDIACEHDVAASHPDVVKRLMGLAEQAREDLGDKNKPGKGQRKIGKIDGEPKVQTKR